MILQKQGTIHLTQPINRIPHCTIMISETDSQMHSGFSRGEWAWGVCCNCSTCVFSLNKSMNFPTTHAWYMSNWERQNDLEWFRTLNFNYWLSIVKTKYHTIADHLSGHDHLPVHISHNRIACGCPVDAIVARCYMHGCCCRLYSYKNLLLYRRRDIRNIHEYRLSYTPFTTSTNDWVRQNSADERMCVKWCSNAYKNRTICDWTDWQMEVGAWFIRS